MSPSRRYLELALAAALAGAAESSARADDDRPLLKLDESSQRETNPPAEAWRESKTLSRPAPPPPARGAGDERAVEPQGEEPMLPGSVPAGKPRLKMRYQGVAPGRAEMPPHPPRLPLSKGPQRLTWPGFQVRDGKPTVFLQLSGPVEYSVSEKPGAVVLTLHGTVANVKNNLRPLIVDSFGTAVRRVSFAARKGTVTVTIQVKGQVAHTERLEQVENGYSMLLLQVAPMGEATAEVRPVPPVTKPEAKPEAKIIEERPAAPAPAISAPAAAPAAESMEAEDQPRERAWSRARTLSGSGVQRGGGAAGAVGGGAAPAAASPPAGKGW